MANKMENDAQYPAPGIDSLAAEQAKRAIVIRYVRDKVDQLLTIMGTLPLNPEELDDETLIALDPIGIIAESFSQILAHLQETNDALLLSKNEIQSILDSVGTPIIVVDNELRLVSYNHQCTQTIFRLLDPQVGNYLCDLLKAPECAYQTMLHSLCTKLASVENADIELNGRHYQVIATPTLNEQGQVVQVIFSFSDISERMEIEGKLRQASVVFENTTEGIMITDEKKHIVAVNQAFCRMTGFTEEEVMGQNPAIFQSGKHDVTFYKKMWRELKQYGHWRGEIWDKRKNGETFPVLQSINKISRADGSISNYVSILTDITAIKKSQETLDFLAYHDPLTKLPNRLLFNERLAHAIQLAKRDKSQLAVIFLDLDRFKTVNDSLGHHIGDKLLIGTAQRLSSQLRASDTIARLGGDEFIILLEEVTDPQTVAILCRNLIAAFQDHFAIDQHILNITPSLGVSLFPGDGQDVDTLIKHADAAMYRAKEEGRNEFQFFTQELSNKAYERLTLEAALRLALQQNQLRLYYQPVVDMASGHVISAEALLRWEHPELGLVSPDKFIPLAEETGLIVPIGEWALNIACDQALRWVRSYSCFQSIAVNISGRQFQGGKLVQTIGQALERSGLDASHLELEITESFLMEKAEQAIKSLDALKALGLSISIDDFGTGYSSLSYLKRFPVDKLKIDQSFIRDITTDPDDAAIAKAVIALGRSMQLRIVAEGIETLEQQAFLIAQDCDLAQGYLYSRPLPADQFETFMLRHYPEH